MRSALLAPLSLLLLAVVAAGQDPGLPPPTPPSAARIDLRAEVEAAIALVGDPARFRADTAAALMRRAYDGLVGLDPARLDLAALDRDPAGLEQRLLDLVLALDERLAGFLAAGQLSDEVADAKRRVLRGVRYVREQVALRARDRDPAAFAAAPAPAIALDLPRHHWVANPALRDRRLASFPDTYLILCVGQSVVSAAIARSGVEDAMFSHMAVAVRAREPQTIGGAQHPAGTWFIIEALIEQGVVVRPLAEHYAAGTTRDVIFFVRDPARQPALDAAAAAFFARARDAIAAGRPLGYDFSMGSRPRRGLADAVSGTPAAAPGATDPGPSDADDLQEFFCAGVGDAVFRKAGVELLTNRTTLRHGPGTKALFEAWGIDPTRRVLAPSDADVTGSLLRVAEGCVLDGLRRSHVGHMVLAEMFSWMDEENWQLRAPWWARAGIGLVGRFNGGPFDLGLVPDGMTPDLLRTFLPLSKAGDRLIERVLAEDEAFRAAHGRSMTPAELRRRTREVRDDVDIGSWLAPAPRVEGRYALETTTTAAGRARVEVEVARGHGLDYEVVRRVLDRDGRVLGEARGTGRQRGETLSVRFRERAGAAPASIAYTIDGEGRISGATTDNARVERGARLDRRVERGARVGP